MAHEIGIFDLARRYNDLARSSSEDAGNTAASRKAALSRDASNQDAIIKTLQNFEEGRISPQIGELMPRMTVEAARAMSEEERTAAFNMHYAAFRLFETTLGIGAQQKYPTKPETDQTLRRMQEFFLRDWKLEGDHYTRQFNSPSEIEMMERLMARVVEAHTGEPAPVRKRLPNGVTIGGHKQIHIDDANYRVEKALLEPILQSERGTSRDRRGG